MNEAEKIGQAFVALVLISRQMGHTDIRSTARDYLLPHASADHSPEQLFVLAAVAGPDGGGMRPDELLPEMMRPTRRWAAWRCRPSPSLTNDSPSSH